ncbi:MinD/ParA family ATP-binding protein [Kibdelosporangium philippinense]|uniref:MinD/ParA family ATP-binding protein n=1 Tax=Kibdelosporangium philippinense TaxID=211113 RepID=UPI003620959B
MLAAFCSLKGSPGVTTMVTAIAARWPVQETPIMVEADPAGGDLAARFRLKESPGLLSLAAAARRGSGPALLRQHSQQLPGGLDVVVGPVGAEQAHKALSVLTSAGAAALRQAADHPGVAVLVDCGRADPDSSAMPIIRAADAMILVARPQDDALAHVAVKLHVVRQWSRKPCFVLVGDGHPTTEVSRVLGIPVLGRVPRDDKGAHVLSGRNRSRHTPMRSALGHAASRIAQVVYTFGHHPSTGVLPQDRASMHEFSAPRDDAQRAPAPPRNGAVS